jgi:dipeptidyl aminopeptidase/acylaminoacyl peptidase
MTDARARAFGSWPSPLSAAHITAGSLRLSQPRLDGGRLHWLEGRPTEGGRQLVMAATREGSPEARTPDGVSVRTRVHEYGGGDFVAHAGALYYSSDAEGRVFALGRGEALTGAGARYADFAVSPDGRWLVAVEERAREGQEPTNQLVAIPLPEGGRPKRLATEFDFVSSPVFASAGDRLAFLAWNHPNLPWDGTELYELEWSAKGAGARRRVAGGASESIFQPRYSPGGRLTFVSDRSGWWNLEQEREGARLLLCPRAAEFGRPQWAFGMSTYDFIQEDQLLCVRGEGGRYRLAELTLGEGRLRDLALPFDAFDGVSVEGREAALLVAGPECPPTVGRLDLASEQFTPVRSSLAETPASNTIAASESWEFPTSDGDTAHAFLYRPKNPAHEGLAGTRPPLLVKSHGGPTGAATSALNLGIQFWTSRGFAVVDVNYRGSTGFGRAYRDRLRENWGVLDVLDCVDAARGLVREGLADPKRLAISGGSAGGYTTLCALTFHDVFQAGASHYGIGDLEALARDTHKFEARYLDGLVGPYPEMKERYVARSPIHHAEQLSCPVIFFQGLEDRVVPPSQAEAMVAVLAARGLPHAYVPFEGEQHGFRRAENQRTALEGELYFYARVFGFETDVAPAGVEIQGL